MIFIKNFKLFIIAVLSFNMNVLARSMSVSQIGDVRIELTDDKWQCDRIECPPEAARCFVSKSNEVDPSILKRVNICYSKDNQVLKQDVSESPIDPKNSIRQQITSSRNGGIVFSGPSDFDEEKFNKELNAQMSQMQANLHSQMAGINQGVNTQMQNLNANLQHMNENINTNLQNQMHHLQENLNKWTCGDFPCPENTYGCKIRLRTDESNRKSLYKSVTCFDKEKHNVLGAGDIIELSKDKIIDIELESYDGAVSVYSTSYGLGGHENAKGVIAVNDLVDLKETAKKNKKAVDDQILN